MKKFKLNRKVFSNLNMSLVTSILCLAFLLMGLSASTLAIFTSEKENYDFVTLTIASPDLNVKITKLDEVVEQEDEEDVNDEEKEEENTNEIDEYKQKELEEETPINNEEETENKYLIENEDEEDNSLQYLIGEDEIGKFNIELSNPSSVDEYVNVTLYDESKEEDNIVKTFITNIDVDSVVSFNISTTTPLRIVFSDLTWSEDVEDSENFIYCDKFIDLGDDVFVNIGLVNVIFNPNYEARLPEGYKEVSYVALKDDILESLSEDELCIKFAEDKVLGLVSGDDEIKAKVFFNTVKEFENMDLIPCLNENNLPGLFYSNGGNFYPLNTNVENTIHGIEVFIDNMDKEGFEEPFELESENIGLYLPFCGYSRFGYHFTYWSYNNEDVSMIPFDEIKEKALTNGDGNIEILANWAANKIIVYNEEGNSVDSTYSINDDLSKLVELPIKEGYNFVGYYNLLGEQVVSKEACLDLPYWIDLLGDNNSVDLKPVFEEIE